MTVSERRSPYESIVHPAVCGLVLCMFSVACLSCSHPEPPEALVELRRMSSSPSLTSSREAAPDLVAEAERSLRRSEEAFERRDTAQARWMATLGSIQARIAVSVARQQEAEARSATAATAMREVEEDLSRYESLRQDAIRQIQRLEAVRSGDGDRSDPVPDPVDGS